MNKLFIIILYKLNNKKTLNCIQLILKTVNLKLMLKSEVQIS